MNNIYLDTYKNNKFEEIEKKYSINFEDKELLVKAFIHPSFNFEVNKNYQRLEFLGDSILQMVISDYMYRNYPNDKEGLMSKVRSTLVSKVSLSLIIKKEELEDYLIVGKSLESETKQFSDSYIADIYESLIASIYLDKGYNKAAKFIYETLITRWDELLQEEPNKDYKTEFQELVQQNGTVNINYEIESDKDGFFVGVKLDGIKVGEGNGKTKKTAEQQAARDALNKLAN